MTTTIPSRLTFTGAIRPGNTVQAHWIAGHPMETGFRIDDSGQRIVRNVITQVRVFLDSQLILELEPGTGMSANPYLAFSLTVPAQGGSLRIEWLDDAGQRGSVQQMLLLEK